MVSSRLRREFGFPGTSGSAFGVLHLIRAISEPKAAQIAEFLDRNTLVNRWMVAFFRNFDSLPREAVLDWGFWIEQTESPGGKGPIPAALLAHSFSRAVSYLVGAADFDFRGIHDLLRADLFPAELIGDSPAMLFLDERCPGLFSSASKREEIVVLDCLPGGSELLRAPAHGFRPAVSSDEPILRDFERAYSRELSEGEGDSDLSALIDRELIFVYEEQGRVLGTIRSNLPDGRYVHAGALYVQPDSRGRGIGAKLLSGICARIHGTGLGVIVTTEGDNRAALSACRRSGFREVGSGVLLKFDEDAWEEGG